MSARKATVLVAAAVLLGGLGGAPQPAGRAEPQTVVVQHILIGFKGSVRGKSIERSKKEAKALADELLARAQAGADFDALVKQYTDDRAPGKYKLTNNGEPRENGAQPRADMVPRFGDVAFSLEPGQIGMAEYSAGSSPFGWHIIKRLE
jgi:hypothetical protein